jgi:hypothetical protein
MTPPVGRLVRLFPSAGTVSRRHVYVIKRKRNAQGAKRLVSLCVSFFFRWKKKKREFLNFFDVAMSEESGTETYFTPVRTGDGIVRVGSNFSAR